MVLILDRRLLDQRCCEPEIYGIVASPHIVIVYCFNFSGECRLG